MIIYVDVDNTICKTNGTDYAHAEPIKKNIDKINKLFNEGHEIIYWTARGVGSGIDWREVTELQLRSWEAQYHKLECGKAGNKPIFDLIIDDKAKRIEEL